MSYSENIQKFLELLDKVVDKYKEYNDLSQGLNSVSQDEYVRIEKNEYLGKEINNYILKGIPQKTIVEIRLLNPDTNKKLNLINDILTSIDGSLDLFSFIEDTFKQTDDKGNVISVNYTFLISKNEILREYDYKSVIYVLRKETQIESKLMLKVPNFDKNFLIETDAIPDYVYYELPFISYTTLIHLLAYWIVVNFEFNDILVLIYLAKTPQSIIADKTPNFLDLYEEYKKRKLLTNILSAVVSTINKSINPQITLQELIKYLLYNEKTQEITEFEKAYQKAKNIISGIVPKIEEIEIRKKIITYTPTGEYTIKKTNSISLTNHGTSHVCNDETSLIPTKNIIKSVAFLKSQTKAVNGKIQFITKENGIFKPLGYLSYEYYKSNSSNIIVDNTDFKKLYYLPPQYVMSISIPSSVWEDVIKYSQFNLGKLYVNRQSVLIQSPKSDGFIDFLISNSPSVSFSYNCLTDKLQVNWTNYYTTVVI
jgi:hypothetical protein